MRTRAAIEFDDGDEEDIELSEARLMIVAGAKRTAKKAPPPKPKPKGRKGKGGAAADADSDDDGGGFGGDGVGGDEHCPPGGAADEDDDCIVAGEYTAEQLDELRRANAIVLDGGDDAVMKLELQVVRDASIVDAVRAEYEQRHGKLKNKAKRPARTVANWNDYRTGQADAAKLQTSRALQ